MIVVSVIRMDEKTDYARYECNSCKTILEVKWDEPITQYKCCKNPQMNILKRVTSEETQNTIKQKIRECYEKIILLHDYYLDWDVEEIKLQAVWDIGTYFYKRFNSFPYRFVTAMKGSGKTRLLSLTEVLVKNGKIASGMTDSALYRSASTHTLLFDEAESISKKEKQAQTEILNSGYKKSSGRILRSKEVRTKDGKDYVTEEFDVYSPKMLVNISGIGSVLLDRCIDSILEKSDNPQKVNLIEDFNSNPDFLDIKRTLEACSVGCVVYDRSEKWNKFRSGSYTHTSLTFSNNLTSSYINIHNINNKYKNMYTFTSIELNEEEFKLFNKLKEVDINGRNFELYYPLFAVAEIIGEDVLTDILNIAKKKTEEKRSEDIFNSQDVSVYDFVASQSERDKYISIIDLIAQFKMFFQADEENIKSLTPEWMGRALKRLNLVIHKKRTSKGMEVMLNIDKAKEKLKMFKDISK